MPPAPRRTPNLPRLLQLALENQKTAVILLTAELTVEYLNPAAEALLKTSIQSAAGANVSALYSDPELSPGGLLAVLANNQSTTSRHVDLILRDGSHTLVDHAVTPLVEQQMLLIEILPLNRLLRINRDDRSVDAQETSRKLVRGLAHEVKNPLGGIRGAAQLLGRELGRTVPDGHLDEYTQIIIEETDRLTDLVDRMLGPNQAPSMQPTNIHRVLARVSRLITAEFGEGIEFRRDFDPSLPRLMADEDLLVQVLLNIVRNAAQALTETPNPTISLKTRVERQFTIGTARHRLVACVEVSDNGPGIPEELFDRVFYPMISGRPEGTGLGLSIAQQILFQHHGALECDSRPGQTCFAVYLPAITDVGQDPAGATQHE
ncbi:MAG: nitrogen regulation protein NR(II) [Pseudomonadales bacterium]